MKKVRINIYLIFISFIVLLCSLCFFNNKHDQNHNIIDINNKKSLEENKISYKHSTIEFDEIFKRIKEIKQKIELEIEKLNNSHDKITIDITENYKRRHVLLDEEEKKVKLNLDKKVTEIKSEKNI